MRAGAPTKDMRWRIDTLFDNSHELTHTISMYKLFALFAALFVFVSTVSADTLVLTHIGAMETKGVKYNQWWYEPQQVVLKGTGSKLANIDITIDGKFNTIKSDAAGKWSYSLGTLDIADHQIRIGSGEESYSFILTIGSAKPADVATTKGGLPETGNYLPLVGILGVGALLVFYSFKKEKIS